MSNDLDLQIKSIEPGAEVKKLTAKWDPSIPIDPIPYSNLILDLQYELDKEILDNLMKRAAQETQLEFDFE